jgi:hypothetical protein
MAHVVLGLGAAAVTVAGAVWYAPAIIDLRAGDDRPVSTRTRAWATLAGWGTGAVLSLLLFTTTSWLVPGAAAAAGATAVTVLAVRALQCGRLEQQEEVRRWTALRLESSDTGDQLPVQHAFLTWLTSGLLLAFVTAAAMLLIVDDDNPLRFAAVASVAGAISTTGLIVASARAHAERRRPAAVRARVPH